MHLDFLNKLRKDQSAGVQDSDALLQEAIALHESGDGHAAEARYLAILRADPNHPDALHLLGLIRHQRGEQDAAVTQIRKAIALKPDKAIYHSNLGNALAAQQLHQAAIASFREAMRLDPSHFQTCYNLGIALSQSGIYAEAAQAFRLAARIKPAAAARYGLAWALMAVADSDLNRAELYDEAAELLRLLLPEAEDPAEAGTALGYCLQQRKHWSAAAEHYEAVLRLQPDRAQVHNNLANCYNQLGRMEQAVAHYRVTYRLAPDFPGALASVMACLNYDPEVTPEQSLREHRSWAEKVAARHYPQLPQHDNVRDPNRPLRIGYVSPDFHRHPVSAIFAPVLAAHEVSRVSTYCYYNYAYEDVVTHRIKSLAGAWRAVKQMDDGTLCEQIRQDRIDILVDLAGHTSDNRLLAFARKPAPIQVSWLGYFNTTGLATMDYFLSDPWSSPPGQERYYAERMLRLPHTRFCYEPPEYMPAVAPLPCMQAGRITFGSLNNLAKLNDRVLILWSQVLHAVPQSRLLLQTAALDDAANRRHFLERWARLGIGPERLELRGFAPMDRSPSTYHEIDIALDPFPFCGGMTSFEALWMGVPVITLPGLVLASRQSASMLANLGLRQLIATSATEYVAIARDLALDRKRLTTMRSDLRRLFAASPLMDYTAFARALEESYRQMWRDYLSGKSRETTAAAPAQG